MELIKAWLQVRTALPGALICPVTRAGHVELRHFADNSLKNIWMCIKKGSYTDVPSTQTPQNLEPP